MKKLRTPNGDQKPAPTIPRWVNVQDMTMEQYSVHRESLLGWSKERTQGMSLEEKIHLLKRGG